MSRRLFRYQVRFTRFPMFFFVFYGRLQFQFCHVCCPSRLVASHFCVQMFTTTCYYRRYATRKQTFLVLQRVRLRIRRVYGSLFPRETLDSTTTSLNTLGVSPRTSYGLGKVSGSRDGSLRGDLYRVYSHNVRKRSRGCTSYVQIIVQESLSRRV